MTTEEQWDAILKYAVARKTAAGSSPVAGGIRGRFIATLVNKVLDFWERHQDTLIPVFSQLAVAAMQALITARSDINAVNTPGPR